MRSWLIALTVVALAGGLSRFMLLGEAGQLSDYFFALSLSLLLVLALAVLLAVFRQRAGEAPLFVVVASAVIGSFYRAELAAGHLRAALNYIFVVAVVALILAMIGCLLRRRLREMA